MNWKFDKILVGSQWVDDYFVQTDKTGKITAHGPSAHSDTYEYVEGYAVPGFINCHSHAFQYDFVGHTENLSIGHASDNFWSWREKMYQLALTIEPEKMQQVAEHLYSHMLASGYTWVVEFHYLHHDKNGAPYHSLSEMGQRLLKAAETTGIGITLVPIFYQKGGFNQNPSPEQRRFISSDLDQYTKLLEDTRKYLNGDRQKLGCGIHSLRAIDPTLLKEFESLGHPIHIHIAEQQSEVEDCLRIHKKRPIEFLAQHVSLSDSWNLVHATHMNPSEIELLASSSANVVICPSTEGNLGDGIFPLREFVQKGGNWCIGSDSHVTVNPCEELRWLDYTQRMSLQRRNPICFREGDESGSQLYLSSQKAAAQSAATHSTIATGHFLDALVISKTARHWQDLPEKHRLSALIYGTDTTEYSGTITAGQWASARK